VGVVRFISEQRQKQILDRARPHLVADEEVLHWVRAKDPRSGRKGLLFVTSHRVVLSWSRKDDVAIPWEGLRSWGVDRDSRGGPVLCMEDAAGERTVVQMVVDTRDMARVVGEFISRFAELAPRSERAAIRDTDGSRFVPSADGSVTHHRRTPAELAKRVALTTLGAGLIVVGIATVPLPGPWSFLLNIAGLAVLAREYDWADDLLGWTKERFEAAKRKVAERKSRRQQT
jgi:uncharacterized protein (TIGR02611 family)